ncbi:MAG: THxN family PEP-CTERM protein [Rhodospirillales bacterium]
MKVQTALLLGSLAVGTLGAFATQTQAAPFEITTSGIWTATMPPVVGTPDTLEGIGTNEIRWGNPAEGQKSGYRFLGLGPTGAHPAAQFADLDALLAAEFDVGDFTHINFPITGGSITQASLQMTMTITDIAGGAPQVLNFSFNFTHNETDNFPGSLGDACPTTGVPQPAVGCPDIVGLQTVFSQEIVNIGGQQLVLEILGFVPGHAGSPISQFLTSENTENLASLVVRFSAPIPEPATLGILGLGLAALGWQQRRRRRS